MLPIFPKQTCKAVVSNSKLGKKRKIEVARCQSPILGGITYLGGEKKIDRRFSCHKTISIFPVKQCKWIEQFFTHITVW